MGLVSTNVLEPLLQKLLACGMEKLVNDTSTLLSGKDKVFLDGDWVGICEDSAAFVAKLRRKRQRKQIPHQVLSRTFSFSVQICFNFGFISVLRQRDSISLSTKMSWL